MTKRMLRRLTVLMSVLALAVTLQPKTHAQQAQRSFPIDIGISYNAERAKIAGVPCGCFWLQGGSADGTIKLYRGVGATISVSGQRASAVTAGVDLSKFSVMAGPRYTLGVSRWTSRYLGEEHSASVFGEALYGYVHGFDSLFPSATGVRTSANSFSMQIGGGMNVNLGRGLGLRALQLDYVRTSLPNSTSNVQNDFRLGVGITYHVHRR